MYKVIRIRVHGSAYDYHIASRTLCDIGRRIVLSRVSDVQMEGAVDINCILVGGWLSRTVVLAKFMCRLAKLRNEIINVEILWGV